jgi:hypothetical protein
MSTNNTDVWKSLEAWRATVFLLAGVLFAGDLLVLLLNLAAGTEGQYMTLGQGLIGAGWTAGFVGLLGFYPSLSERGRWLPRIGSVFAVVGLVTMAVMAVVSFGLVGGVVGGELADYTPYFLPGVFLGTVFGFGLYGFATLRTGVYRTSVGALLLLLVFTFLFNLGTGIAGFNPLSKVTGVVFVLTAANLALGQLLRTRSAEAAAATGAPDSTA